MISHDSIKCGSGGQNRILKSECTCRPRIPDSVMSNFHISARLENIASAMFDAHWPNGVLAPSLLLKNHYYYCFRMSGRVGVGAWGKFLQRGSEGDEWRDNSLL